MVSNHMKSLAAFGALALSATFATQSSALEDVTFGTNWLAQAEHGGFYQSVADGTYEACGLNVTVAPGGPQVNNRALMLAGKIEFHMGGNMLQPFSAAEQNIPVVVLASMFQKEPQVLISHPDQGFDTWESLKGAKLFLGENGFQSYYKWMIAEHGFTVEQREPYTFNAAPFLADKKSAQQGYITSEPFAIEREGGFKPNLFLLADYGFDTYSTTIEAMQATIDAKPEIVKCFIDGSILGWVNYLYGDNAAANEMIKKDNPDITDEQIAFSIETMKEFGIVDSGDSETMGIGAMTDARQKSFYDKMVAAGVTPADLDISKIYTLDFINKGVGVELKKKLTGM
ncbi:ABC transporter substrate-binding protein [Pararhizobium sp. IMCC21322]|uniref:ABC transporter substrate-binding protein n=1 Tax=Pararhizobium sp. IMCC21322 TaxID=3067903 RepID=UPI003532757A